MVNNYHLDPIFHALADPSRRAFLEQLRESSLRVSDLKPVVTMSKAAVSKHIRVLLDANLIRVEKKGREKLCTLNVATLRTAQDWVTTTTEFWTERLDALDQYLQGENNE